MMKTIPVYQVFRWCSRKRAMHYMLGGLLLLASCKTKSPEPTAKPGELTSLPYNTIPQDTLEKYLQRQRGWGLVGNVFMDPENSDSVSIEKGTEILLFNLAINKANSQTEGTDTHPKLVWPGALELGVVHGGDMELELDFMMGKGSTLYVILGGYYLFPAYHIHQSADSQDQDSLVFGARYERSRKQYQEAYKKSGLWQHLHVRFSAPRLDANNNLIDSARFEDIVLNGQHLPGFTPKAISSKESSGPAPLAVQTIGTCAIRNIQYKTFTDDRLSAQNIQYAVYKGIFKEYDTLKKLTPLRTGTTDSLTWKIGDKRAQVSFTGTLRVPKAGGYLFRLRAGGPAWLLINDREVVNNHGTRDFVRPFYDSIYLKAGDHPFQVIYANYDQSLVLDYEGPGIPFTRLTAPTAERHEEKIDPLEYVVSTEPGIQRGFFMHHGEVNTYTMAIGIPGGLNYAYDINTYTLLSAWRGRFIDVSNMWTSRGESQRELPLGAVLELSGVPSVQSLADEKNVWQDTVAADKTPFTKRSYRIDADGLPVFQYTFNGATIEDSWRASPKGDGLVRSVTVSNAAEVSNVYFILGNGRKVEKLPHGGYAIDDKAYYLTEPTGLDSKALRIVQARDGRYALMLPLAGPAGKRSSFQYTILW